MFEQKKILITGGTGSFGSYVLKHLLKNDIDEVRIFSRDEKKQHDFRTRFKSDKIKYYIGDVRDFDSINKAVKGIDYVFSAAALKQVPSCEFYPLEAVKTNVFGTYNVIKSSIENNVSKAVILSTDKAVYPINAMGMSKAIMEKVTIAESRNVFNKKTILSNTRYGNVMASRGSVIPHFINQIKSNQPVTITDPDMTRFMMSLDQSVDLVFHAFNKAIQGATYIQKAPSSKIITLAKALYKIFDKKENIKIIGTRHGEKKHECLINREEMVRTVDEIKYYCILPDTRDLKYDKYFNDGKKEITESEDYTSANTKVLNIEELVELLLKLDYIKNELSIES